MSKASEWVKSRPGRPEFQVDTLHCVVSDHGDFKVLRHCTVTPEDALALAQWINSTFGEAN